MSVESHIARRYFPTHRHQGSAGAITRVALCGIAVAIAAIVCVLSVFNGFRAVLIQNSTSLSPDVIILPDSGKTIPNYPAFIDKINTIPDVKAVTPTLTGRALAVCAGQEMPVMVKGVEEADYPKVSRIRNLLYGDGTYSLSGTPENVPSGTSGEEFSEEALLEELDSETPASKAIISAGVAVRLDAHPGEKDFILFTPRKDRTINLANPVNSFIMEKTEVSAVFSSHQSEFDKDYVIVPITLAQRLFGFTDEIGALEVSVADGKDPADVAEKIRQILGPEVVVKDRLMQQSLNFRMVSIEKWITFLLLAFILVIASFNILASLSMLVIEKDTDLGTLRSIGLNRASIGKIFMWESFFLSAIGTLAGIVLGLLLCWLQKDFGLIKLSGDPSSLLLTAYPVEVHWLDILVILGASVLISVFIGLTVAAFARRRSG